MPKVVSLTTNASPNRFGDADATSQYFITNRRDGLPIGAVSVQYTGAWEGVSLLIETCLDLTASPQIWATEATKTADGIYHFSPSPGTAVRCSIESSGSPIPDLSVQIRSDFDGQTGT